MTVKMVVPTRGSRDSSLKAVVICLEAAVRGVLADAVPGKVLTVHRDVDAGRQHLDERQRAAEVEQPVRAPERIRHHRSGEHDGLAVEPGTGQRPRGLDHRVGAVGDHHRGLVAVARPGDDSLASLVVELEAVDHHHGFGRDVQQATAPPEHLG